MSNKRPNLPSIATFLIILAGLCLGPCLAAADDIKIGFTPPVTGASAAEGAWQLKAIKLALKQINEAGGVNGKTINLIIEDNQSSNPGALAALQKAVEQDQVLALVGVFFLVGGAIRFILQPSLEQLIESVRDGTLDFTLVKPEDAQLVSSIQRVEIWQLTDVGLGIGVLAVALARLGERVGFLQSVEFAGALLAGGVIVYSFWIMLATTAFWLVRVENILVVFQSMYEAGRWPVSIYPRWLRFALTFIVPVGFAVTVPAQALAGQLSWPLLAAAAALAVALFAAARLLWRAGLRRYQGASS